MFADHVHDLISLVAKGLKAGFSLFSQPILGPKAIDGHGEWHLPGLHHRLYDPHADVDGDRHLGIVST